MAESQAEPLPPSANEAECRREGAAPRAGGSGTTPEAAAKDLVPLAKVIFGVLKSMRGKGNVPLPPDAAMFFLCAAMAGVSQFLVEDLGLGGRMREVANALAPEIARLLREEVRSARKTAER
jgi:hypothetical protein